MKEKKRRSFSSWIFLFLCSAFMIGDGKLLTNAHCVEYNTQAISECLTSSSFFLTYKLLSITSLIYWVDVHWPSLLCSSLCWNTIELRLFFGRSLPYMDLVYFTKWLHAFGNQLLWVLPFSLWWFQLQWTLSFPIFSYC